MPERSTPGCALEPSCQWLFFVLVFIGLANGVLDSRDSRSALCTLEAHPDRCQLRSRLDALEGIHMFFGETQCNVTLRNCRKDTCYVFRDLTDFLPREAGLAATTGFLSSFEVLDGADSVGFSRVGAAFRATAGEVSIRYSTQTCRAFYKNHGRIERQLCGHPVEAISNVDERGPEDTLLDCT